MSREPDRFGIDTSRVARESGPETARAVEMMAERLEMAITENGELRSKVNAYRAEVEKLRVKSAQNIKMVELAGGPTINHGMEALVEQSVYGTFTHWSQTQGGIWMQGLTESEIAVGVTAEYTTGDTGKDATADAAFEVWGRKKSGTGIGAMAAGENIVSFTNNGTAVFLVDSDGQTWQAGAATINEDGDDADTRVEGDTLTHMIFVDASAATENIALLAGAAPNWQSMDVGMFVGDTATAPTGNPSSGGFLYVVAGALTWRGSGGTVTTIAPA